MQEGPAYGDTVSPTLSPWLATAGEAEIRMKGPDLSSPFLPLGSVGGVIPPPDALLEPADNFALHPPYSRLAKSYPLGELSCLLESVDVSEAVEDKLTHLLLG